MRDQFEVNSGSKAGNLKQLMELGFSVPEFIVLETIINHEKEFYASLPGNISLDGLFAVRSSASVEDGSEKSYAGHFYSEIGVNYKSLYKAYIKVCESYKGLKGAVIIQQFINSEKAGILFSDDGKGRLIVDANFGLCKTVVEGKSCDEYLLSKKGKIIAATIAENKVPLFCDNYGLLFEGSQTNKPVLTKRELKNLVTLALEIENHFSIPQDIEWCIKGGKIYILQSRPVTRSIDSGQSAVIYDSANIAESYSGIVKPLTFSFARQIYKTVYINLLCASGASRKKVLRHPEIFENMLQLFHGRMFYNMNNWYLMMTFIPGYKRNKKNLELMISSNLVGEVEEEIVPGYFLKIFYPFIVLIKLIAMPIVTANFQRRVKEKLDYYRKQDFKRYNWNSCITIYSDLRKSLLEKWHIPVENDFMVMTYWGILKKKIAEDQLHGYVNFDNISVQQISAISELSFLFYSYPAFIKLLDNNDVTGFNNEIKNCPVLLKALDDYFARYGGRFANELKLESPDIEEDRHKLIQLLRLYKNHNPVKHSKILQAEPADFFMRWVLSRFKKYASKREEMRLLRSNCFSLVRKVFKRMGDILAENNLIEKADDIFYLELEFLLQAGSPENLTGISDDIKRNKKLYKQYEQIQPQSYFKIIQGEEIPLKHTVNQESEILFGRPCTPGICEGIVRVFTEYSLPDSIDFDILITSHTDPGWTTLIGLSKGLIIEHGGILSHAAIVSRELGIPTVIGLAGATKLYRTGQKVHLNGNTGQVRHITL